jgi:hypothetical protein
MAGQQVLVGTYHCGSVGKTFIRDEKTQKSREAQIVRQTVLTDEDAVAVTEWLPDGADGSLWRPAFKRGDRVVVLVKSRENVQGFVRVQGVIARFEG